MSYLNNSLIEDIRQVAQGDPSPDGKGHLNIMRGIEVGHIFQLGEKYSRTMGAKILNETGKQEYVAMGCYGSGVSRIVAAAIEQNHDEKGIIWPKSISPFNVGLINLNNKSKELIKISDELYSYLTNNNIDVLYDDTIDRPGEKFANMDLIGIPSQIIIGEKSFNENCVEIKDRKTSNLTQVKIDAFDKIIKNI